MSKGTSCQGCGALLQSEHPDRAGYVPPHVLNRSDQVRCQRCYRLSHYGVHQAGNNTHQPVVQAAGDAVDEVRAAVKSADAVLYVADIWDFEGSFLPELLTSVSEPLLLAVNKIDLLPLRTPAQEVLAWVRTRCREAGVTPAEIRLMSAERGAGVKALYRTLEKMLPGGGRIAVVGITNAGKSTLLRRWLPRHAPGPTTSTLPGTTQKTLEYELARTGHVILDTPGLAAGNRLPDLLCPTCATALVPKARLRSKLVQLRPGGSLMFGGLAAVTALETSGDATVTLAFTAEKVPIHVTRDERVLPLLQNGDRSWLHTTCTVCRRRFDESGWENVRMKVDDGEDLVLPGLGWISPRKGTLDAVVTVPAGSQVVVRPRLIGTKKTAKPVRMPRRRS